MSKEIYPPVDEEPVDEELYDEEPEDDEEQDEELADEDDGEEGEQSWQEYLRERKRKRLKAILQFAYSQEYLGQHALLRYLDELGVGCKQPQLSKDLDALGLAPYIDRLGVKRLGRRSKIVVNSLEERYVKIFCEAVLEVNAVEDKVLLETVPNGGQVTASVIEAAHWPEILCVAYGISNVIIFCIDEDAAIDIRGRLKEGIL